MDKRKISLLSFLLIIIMLLVIATACQSTPAVEPEGEQATEEEGELVEPEEETGEATELHVVFQTGGDILVAQEFEDDFEAEYNADITLEEIPVESLYEKLVTEFVTQSGAYDLVEFYPTWLGSFAEAGYIVQLDEYFDKYSDMINPDDYLEGVDNAASWWKGHRYGIPFDGDVVIFYYREDLFSDPTNQADFEAEYGYPLVPPDTWDQVMDMAEFFDGRPADASEVEIGTEELDGIAMISARHWWAVGYWSSVYYSYGGDFFDEETGEVLLNREAWNQANAVWTKFIEHAPQGILNFGYTEAKEAIGSGEVAMGIQWATTVFVDPRQSPAHELLAYSVMPGVEQPDGSIFRSPALPVGKVLAIPASSENPEQAFLFGMMLSSPEAQVWATTNGTGIDPNRASVFADESVQEAWQEIVPVYEASLEIGVPDIRVPDSANYYDVISAELHSVWSGTKDSDAAFDDTLAEWQRIASE